MRWRETTTAVVVAGVLVATAAPALAIPEGPEEGTPEWYEREQANYAKTREEANRQFSSPAFQQRLTEQTAANVVAYGQFQAANAFANQGNLCNHWMDTCAGDPFLYPGASDFFDDVGAFAEVLFHDAQCARLSGRVWAPYDPAPDLPGIVITNGSVQAPETLYWWAAHALVDAGYIVMTWDPRGQGRSDTQTPDGQQGSNANSVVFWDNTVDAVDFFHSTPEDPYPHNAACQASAPLPNGTDVNPFHANLDRSRLGLAGHSLGALGVSVVQGYETWPGTVAGPENPVDVVVGWDSLAGDVLPRVPAMGQSSEYGLVNVPFDSAPDPEEHKGSGAVVGGPGAYATWTAAGIPVSQFTIQGSTHYEWSLIPSRPVANFSSTSWVDWGLPMARHHTVAWFDRWLKEPGEPGYDTADARLLADLEFCERFSFYFRSARNFPMRDGTPQVNEDIRASCLEGVDPLAVQTPPATEPEPAPTPEPTPAPLPATGGGLAMVGVAALVVARRLRG